MIGGKVSSWTLGASADQFRSTPLHLPIPFWHHVPLSQHAPSAFLVARTKDCGKTLLLAWVSPGHGMTVGKLLYFWLPGLSLLRSGVNNRPFLSCVAVVRIK